MNLIAVVTPELVYAIGELAVVMPGNPVVEFLSRVHIGDAIVSEPANAHPETMREPVPADSSDGPST